MAEHSMADDATMVELSRSDLREIVDYAVACARPALTIFERERPGESPQLHSSAQGVPPQEGRPELFPPPFAQSLAQEGCG